MKKVRVSFDGRFFAATYDIEQLADDGRFFAATGEPDLVISRGGVVLKVNFESDREKKRFYRGVNLCRGQYMDGKGIVHDIYLSSTSKPSA